MTIEVTPANFQSTLDSSIGKNFGFAKDINRSYINEIAYLLGEQSMKGLLG